MNRSIILKIGGGLAGAILISVLVYQIFFATHGEAEDLTNLDESLQKTASVPVETVGSEQVEGSDDLGVSWPGEIVSLGDVEVHSLREGQIVEWRVKIGEYVKQGQVLGTLNVLPSPELIAMSAESAKAVELARANASATATLVQQSKKQLLALKDALNQSKESAIKVIENEALQNLQTSKGALQSLNSTESAKSAIIISANAELEQAKSLIALRQKAARAAIEKLSRSFVGEIMTDGRIPVSPDSQYFNVGYGLNNTQIRREFLDTLNRFITSLKESEALPEAEAYEYIAVSKRLLADTYANGGESALSAARISEVRDILIDDEKMMIEALKEYKEAQTMVLVKEAEIKRITAEQEREVSNAQVDLKNSEIVLAITDSIKKNKSIEVDTEFTREKIELDVRIAELDRELALAQAEIRAANAAYEAISNGLGGKTVVALKSGVISGIYKNVGDQVTPETAIASINSQNKSEKFIRFRIPSNMPIPERGSILTVTRPGYPHETKKVKLLGVGTALHDNGVFVSDAQFIEQVDWPVRISVRVMPPAGLLPSVSIPFAAVWFDSSEQPNVWLVTEEDRIRPQQIKIGRTLGDKIEVIDGLQKDNRYVAKVSDGLVQGMMLSDIKAEANEGSDEPASDDHGH